MRRRRARAFKTAYPLQSYPQGQGTGLPFAQGQHQGGQWNGYGQGGYGQQAPQGNGAQNGYAAPPPQCEFRFSQLHETSRSRTELSFYVQTRTTVRTVTLATKILRHMEKDQTCNTHPLNLLPQQLPRPPPNPTTLLLQVPLLPGSRQSRKRLLNV